MDNVLKMRQTVKRLREIAKDMPIQQLAVFLEVCTNEGISMKELGKRLDMPQSSITRNVKRLSQFKNGTKIEGYELVKTSPDNDNPRQLIIYLTEQGKQLKEELNELLA